MGRSRLSAGCRSFKGSNPFPHIAPANRQANAADMTLMLDAMVYVLRQKVSHMYLVTQ
jgi:hypothetical protein